MEQVEVIRIRVRGMFDNETPFVPSVVIGVFCIAKPQ
jgi:hypothetical protein